MLNLVVFLQTFLLTMATTSACPESCFCMDSFVSCSDFTFLDLTLLPPETDTLVLSKGEVEELPPGFLAMATKLKMLEIISVNARIVRGSAFRGLRRLDVFTITSSSFDIVEPDSFSGLTEVGRFDISGSKFGRVGKHAFGYMNNIHDFKIWSNNFETISDEAFYRLSNVSSFQFFRNNITFMGRNVFSGAFTIEEITISRNIIQTVLEGSFEVIAEATSRLVFHINTFVCSCDISWILDKPVLKDYLEYNYCTFSESPQSAESTFTMNHITKDALCRSVPSTDIVDSIPSDTNVDANKMESIASDTNVDANNKTEMLNNIEEDFIDISEDFLIEMFTSASSSSLPSAPNAPSTTSSTPASSSSSSSSYLLIQENSSSVTFKEDNSSFTGALSPSSSITATEVNHTTVPRSSTVSFLLSSLSASAESSTVSSSSTLLNQSSATHELGRSSSQHISSQTLSSHFFSSQETSSATSVVPSNISIQIPDTAGPTVHEMYNGTPDAVQQPTHSEPTHSETTPSETISMDSFSSDIHAYPAADTPEHESEAVSGMRTTALNKVPIDLPKGEFALAYSTAAFEMAESHLENASKLDSGSLLLVAMLGGLCLLLMGAPPV